ncbi:50S ribosomal protein L17 [Emticicia sp. CRIBPO]|uniref:50S ribosomal protein L17 n=1 Tax=Emticicia sp. CRIBPO TaxID=2683258 RepID=UPI00141321B6|nr:50S ribosomal protein L17 [Emticicia sp. CRIBPO]NBA87492.1 50S ribosomal protein L17 [Emticicia sp. CRIBPO]
MRHGKKVNHLSRTKSHRDALLSNMANSLIKSKRISTTLAKAKELRKYVEPLITKAKLDTTHSRRVIFSYLQDKESIKSLFGEIAEKVAERNGGYTRIIKLGSRQGDNAEVALIELVDFNEVLLTAATEESATKTKRSRRGKTTKKSDTPEVAAVAAAEVEPAVVEAEATVVEEVVAEAAPAAEEAAPEEPKASDEESTEETK